jgi:DNA-binding CsgD family transcriptional regulator
VAKDRVVLVGRDAEMSRIDGLLEASQRGRGGALTLRGEPGIGKTALLDAARARAAREGMRILSTRGVESESRLAFAGLGDLLRPAVGRLDEIPEAQRAAIRAALALGPPLVPDRFAAYAATLSLLCALAADGPLLVVADDAHWLDAPTLEALAFCARRIADEPIAMIGASRIPTGAGAGLPDLEVVSLGALDDPASRALLEEAGVRGGAAERILALAGGNPLALVELPRSLTSAQRAGEAPAEEPLPVGEVLVAAFGQRLELLPSGARAALLLAATSHDGALGPLTTALGGAGGRLEGLIAAEQQGLVTLREERVTFRHPLLRAVVLQLASASERREAHRALASALEGTGADEQRAWHLAEASLGPDEAVAAALEAVAGRAMGRTGFASAAAALRRAASLSPDRAAAARRLVAAAQAAWLAGRPEEASAALDAVLAGPGDGRARAEASRMRALIGMQHEPVDRAYEALVATAGAVASDEPLLAAEILADAVLTRTMAGRCDDALAVARRSLLAVPPGTPPPLSTLGYLAAAQVLTGGRREAAPVLARLAPRLREVSDLTPLTAVMSALFSVQVMVEDFDAAELHARAWIEPAREASALGTLGLPLALASELDFRRGRWDLARARAEEAVDLLEEADLAVPLARALVGLGHVEAAIGEEDLCRAHVARGHELADARGVGSITAYARAALGLLELGAGRAAAAVGHLEPLVGFTAASGLREPATVQWQPDLVEAYVREGRLDDARAVLATLSEQAHRTGGSWARAVTCRGRGMIAPDFAHHFREALALHVLTPTPFERARTQLTFGGRLRREGRRAEAREHLESALATFDALGARPWSAQAREQIAASGQRLRPRARGTDDLSPRELQVAMAVAEGATNREAAARLFLSEKTVERHLGSVYRKLRVRSRSELAARFARAGAGEEAAPGPTVRP